MMKISENFIDTHLTEFCRESDPLGEVGGERLKQAVKEIGEKLVKKQRRNHQ
jgi:hypothetical protein